MTGARRTAVLAAAFLLLTVAWATAESPPQHILRSGAAVVFVTDASLDPGRREGDVIGVHLRDPIVVDGETLAAAGTRAQLVVGGTTMPDGKRRPAITIEHFQISAGLLPVKPLKPIVPPVAAGTPIDATTQAEIEHLGDRWSIRIPFPFRLGGDPPASAYTPTPARTANPNLITRPGGAPPTRPTPVPSNPPMPSPTAPAPP